MEIREQERELLLGYLLNVLDDHKVAQVEQTLAHQPHLRAELATLQRELAPLNYMGDSVEPPPQLASRTCATIWATFNNKEQDTTSNKDSVLGFLSDPYKTVVALPALSDPVPKTAAIIRTPHIGKGNVAPPPRSSHWTELIVSVSVGMVLAFLLFPMIQYTKRRTQTYVTENWMSEINRRVDQYEQIHGNPGNAPFIEEMLPFNLALNSWQELRSEALTSPYPRREIDNSGRLRGWGWDKFLEDMVVQIRSESLVSQNKNEVIRGQQRSFWVDFDGRDVPISLDMDGVSDRMLLSIPGGENSVRSAVGQDILLKEGRIFFRILPGTAPPKK